MAQTVSLATNAPASPAPLNSRSSGVASVRTEDAAEAGASGRSVFDRLGNRSTASTAAQPQQQQPAVAGENNSAAIVTEDEDGEMTGSTSDDEPVQTNKGSVSGSRILSLRTVVGTSGRTGSSNRSGRHSPIIYDHPTDSLTENRTASTSSSKSQMVSSVTRNTRHPNSGIYERSRAPQEPVPHVHPDMRRRRSSISSNHAYDKQHSNSHTPPHLSEYGGVKYDRHGNLRRTPAAATSPGPHSHGVKHGCESHPYFSSSSSRSQAPRRRWSPSESNQRSYASPSSSSSKHEKYRQYFDEYRKRGDRPQRTDSCDRLMTDSRTLPDRSVSSAFRNNDLIEREVRSSDRVSSGSSRTSQRQNDKAELRSVVTLKAGPEHEVEEGEDFSDWSEAEAEKEDDLDSISSTDELLAQILTTNSQQCSEMGSHELLKDQDNDAIDQSNNYNDRKSTSACTASTNQTESWKRLLSVTQPLPEAKDRIRCTGIKRWGRGGGAAAYALQSSGFSSQLAGSDLSDELNQLIRENCTTGSDTTDTALRQQPSLQENNSAGISTAHSPD